MGFGFGIYIHFPFCLSKCPYCDFASTVERSVPHARYARAIVRELSLRASAAEGRAAGSIYFGGGTPSLWEPRALGEVLQTLRGAVAIAGAPEITLEANPGASEAARFAAFRALGINRLSLGLQSLNSDTLTRLGRRHSVQEGLEAAARAREAGFEALALDLIFGAPAQTLPMAREDARAAASLRPEHLSCYALTLDHLATEVPMARAVREGRTTVPDDDEQWQMGRAVEEELERAGYRRYEISNWSRPGQEARHNSLYWTGGEYLGLGCGACGFVYDDPAAPARGGRRWSNFRALKPYLEAIEAGRLPEESSERLEPADLLRERLAMGLRRVEGVRLAEVCGALEVPLEPTLEQARGLVAQGLAVLEDGTLRLTPRGLDFHTDAAMSFV